MARKPVSLDFSLKEMNEIRKYPLEEIKHNDLINEKHQNVCRGSIYFKRFFPTISAVTGCV